MANANAICLCHTAVTLKGKTDVQHLPSGGRIIWEIGKTAKSFGGVWMILYSTSCA
jgi:hypothetical protein